MSFDKEIRESLKLHEGVRTHPYTDTKGILTIGVGHNLERGLHPDVINLQLEKDIEETLEDLDRDLPEWRGFSKKRRVALADMMFNLGAKRFHGFVKMRKALKLQDFDKAAEEMLDSKWSRQVGARAERLADMMRAG